MDRSLSNEDRAVPGVAPRTHDRAEDATFTVEVDGELFAVTEGADGDNGYVWLSGPNSGYGFGESGPPNRSQDDHRRAIRGFLDQIDQDTGYIEEE